MEVINHPVDFDVGAIQSIYMGCSTLVLMTYPRDTAGDEATTRPHIIGYLVAYYSSPLFISEKNTCSILFLASCTSTY